MTLYCYQTNCSACLCNKNIVVPLISIIITCRQIFGFQFLSKYHVLQYFRLSKQFYGLNTLKIRRIEIDSVAIRCEIISGFECDDYLGF